MSQRASERQIAQLLRLMAEQPNQRTARQEGDPAGEFDAWFDGGALRYVTGHTEYVFADGTSARVATSPLVLQVTLRFADGTTVSISQQ